MTGSPVAGLAPSLKLILRRDRILLPVWFYIFVAMPISSIVSAKGLYGTHELLRSAADSANGNPSLVAMFGPIYAPEPGAVAMVKMTVMMGACLALLTGLLVIRHTRADEESGRRELLGAAAISRIAAPVGAMIEATALSVAIGVVTAIGTAALGAPVGGAVTFGTVWALTGIVFAAAALVCAQLAEGARAARGLFAAVLAVAYLLRALGDLQGGNVNPAAWSWVSPLGWAQQMRPYAGDRWWPAALLVVGAVVLAAIGLWIAERRDLGAGVIAVGGGRATAAASLRSAPALAWRLHRSAIGMWTVAFLAVGIAFGGMASAVEGLLDSQNAADMVRRLGGGAADIVDSFFGAEFSIMGMVAAVLAISLAIGPAAEERAGRAEYLLAAPVRRTTWFAAQLVIALAGSASVMLAAGIGASLVASRELVPAALGVLPAVWILTAVGALAGALSSRWTAVAWVALTLCVLVLVGDVLRLPAAVNRLSPFTHVVTQPGTSIATTGAVVLVLLAGAGLVGSVAVVSRRDLAS
ncbi:hypothetical protein P0W64_13665 [Tsukamurella sp. 8F]|uniref:ABC transporter permease n=1 Tax=unclassified Tsukamurella TaxID=2633480 RepID=UPI0023BA26C1|nr:MULTISPECIES: hypothetical protein [unclassified Tsukamurella]MDF0530619.1 hypothetical protein [Tsukamurella sp. 8J]MDF0587820.1 hypothetical protein [Tsukamurella sp. 8F]